MGGMSAVTWATNKDAKDYPSNILPARCAKVCQHFGGQRVRYFIWQIQSLCTQITTIDILGNIGQSKKIMVAMLNQSYPWGHYFKFTSFLHIPLWLKVWCMTWIEHVTHLQTHHLPQNSKHMEIRRKPVMPRFGQIMPNSWNSSQRCQYLLQCIFLFKIMKFFWMKSNANLHRMNLPPSMKHFNCFDKWFSTVIGNFLTDKLVFALNRSQSGPTFA